ncbi:hypothetical protein HYH02_015143 [Chlamydomonas schloesseri]|uniref:Metallo-beta-lactamase domain-containing protein n=1 Tax=Chlamydomonas schloesseri TaxID=2026947 RepID=A0A835SRU7_9CHLO|nr:hypothetical protein HYH02_015143 [Chlamydomonas schloesseri]|eukprot:KAG2424761.1 hypothetical protein HYH02_015143 [Chlamydomonas schloesseri]
MLRGLQSQASTAAAWGAGSNTGFSAGGSGSSSSSSSNVLWPRPVRRWQHSSSSSSPSSSFSFSPAPASSSSRRCRRTVSVAATMDWRNRRNGREPRPENAPGSFFVDKTCIDCDTCRWMAPETFGRVGAQSAVVAQPAAGDRQGRVRALQALLSCPTYSIHVTDRTPAELKAAQQGLPAPVPGLPPPPPPPPLLTAPRLPAAVPDEAPGSAAAAPEAAAAAAAAAPAAAAAAAGSSVAAEPSGEPLRPGVYYTGWTTEKSYAGCPYLIVRPEGGNVLVDSPRYNPVLAARLAAAGGVRYMFLTHRDDVGDHQAWADHFGAQRILHEKECNSRQGTDKVEIKLRGEGPWVLTAGGEVVPRSEAGVGAAAGAAAGAAHQPDVEFVFTPGHTAGHVCLYYAPQQVLFSGDHLCSAEGEVEEEEGGPGSQPAAEQLLQQQDLYVFEDFCWHDFRRQLRSVAALLAYDWLHVLPAHGRRAHLKDAASRLAAVGRLLQKHGAEAEAAEEVARQGQQQGQGHVAKAAAAR